MLHSPIVHAHDISKQIPREKNFPVGWKCYKTIGSYVSCKFIEIWSPWEVWRALKKPRETLTHLSCSPNFPRASYLDERTLTYEPIVKSQLTWIRIPSLTWRTVKSSLLAPYSGLVHRGVSRGIKRRLIQVPNGIIFPSFLWEMHPHILLHKLRVTHATLRCKWHETFWLLLQLQAAQAHVSKSQRWIHERVTRCVTRCLVTGGTVENLNTF